MKAKFLTVITLGLLLVACSEDSKPTAAETTDNGSSTEDSSAEPVDYSKGRAMNKRLGKGINLGNAWDGASYYTCGTLKDDLDAEKTDSYVPLAPADSSYLNNMPSKQYNYGCADRLDSSWNNPIKDEYFQLVKSAGFNSVRIPVRWQHNSNPETHEVNPARLNGVMDDIKLAIDAGLAVVVSFHWYHEIMYAGNHATTNPDYYAKEKQHFAAIWSQVAAKAEALNFPDSMLVWDILNEPTFVNTDILNDVMMTGYDAIRAAAPGKTIMFEAHHAAKFGDLGALKLPKDGNIIFSGHYYEPYTYSHQGHGYACKGDDAYANTAKTDMKNYVAQAKKLYPDVNGGNIPMNMGEFSVTSQYGGCGKQGPSDKMRAKWAQTTIEAAEMYDVSWHYWALAGVGGFEAYDKQNNTWYPGFPMAFGL